MTSNRLLGLVADGPPVLLTLGAALVVGGLLPAGVQLALWSAGAMVVVLLRLGAWEDPATRLLVGCRPIRPPELELLRPALSDLAGKTAKPSCLYLSHQGHAAAGVMAAALIAASYLSPAANRARQRRRHMAANARLPQRRAAPSTRPTLMIASQLGREGVMPGSDGAPGAGKPRHERHLTVVR